MDWNTQKGYHVSLRTLQFTPIGCQRRQRGVDIIPSMGIRTMTSGLRQHSARREYQSYFAYFRFLGTYFSQARRCLIQKDPA